MPNQLVQRLAPLAPKLRAELLHRVIDAVGLEDCGDLIAQATPAQLSHLLDLDLWRSPRPGLDECFDAGRFGVWIGVLADSGAEVAAAKLAGMPLAQVVAGLAQHVRVYDVAAVSSYVTTDGTRLDYSRPVRDLVGCEMGGYHVAAIREDAWDAIVDVLTALDMHHPEKFVALMRTLRARSHSAREADGFHALLENRAQMMFEVADDRDRRRQQRGFASPADARTFLQMSRSVRPQSIAPNAIAHDYQRAMRIDAMAPDAFTADAAEEIEATALLADAGIVTVAPPRGLLGSGEAEADSRLEEYLRIVFETDPAAYGDRNFELAYLANVLITGCSLQSRAFSTKEATDAAVATCNLGLERISPPASYLIANDLIGVFQVGWTVLYEDVCLQTARTLADMLGVIRVHDDEVRRALAALHLRLLRELKAGTPWRAAGGLEVMMAIDPPAWAALVGLIAECPVIHAGLNASLDPQIAAVDPDAFAFIAHADQLDRVRAFMRQLPSSF